MRAGVPKKPPPHGEKPTKSTPVEPLEAISTARPGLGIRQGTGRLLLVRVAIEIVVLAGPTATKRLAPSQTSPIREAAIIVVRLPQRQGPLSGPPFMAVSSYPTPVAFIAI